MFVLFNIRVSSSILASMNANLCSDALGWGVGGSTDIWLDARLKGSKVPLLGPMPPNIVAAGEGWCVFLHVLPKAW